MSTSLLCGVHLAEAACPKAAALQTRAAPVTCEFWSSLDAQHKASLPALWLSIEMLKHCVACRHRRAEGKEGKEGSSDAGKDPPESPLKYYFANKVSCCCCCCCLPHRAAARQDPSTQPVHLSSRVRGRSRRRSRRSWPWTLQCVPRRRSQAPEAACSPSACADEGLARVPLHPVLCGLPLCLYECSLPLTRRVCQLVCEPHCRTRLSMRCVEGVCRPVLGRTPETHELVAWSAPLC